MCCTDEQNPYCHDEIPSDPETSKSLAAVALLTVGQVPMEASSAIATVK
jgi:hypothetical protein